MFISVIIPTCNRNSLLVSCLNLLSNDIQKLNFTSYEVIVSDDGPNNEAKELIINNYPSVKWLEGPKCGPAANRNNAVGKAKGDWILFIDDDCLPSENLLNSYLSAIQSYPDISVFEGSIITNEIKTRLDQISPINLNGGCLWSCNFLIKKSLFLKVKCFNSEFPYACMEDVDFFDRVNKIEVILFLKNSFVTHPYRIEKNPSNFYKKSLISHFIYFKINPDKKREFRLTNYGIRVLKSIIFTTVPDIIRYRGKGILYPLYYHYLQLRIAIFCTFK
jgi:GT2 family glycosyltransferase